MLQLAQEAFEAANFDLASEIYQCQAAGERDPYCRQELLVKRADALAHAGKLTEALTVYRQAADTERLQTGQLSRLTDCLLQGLRGKGPMSGAALPDDVQLVSCPLCLSVLSEPVTLACGHSCCKPCLEREQCPPVCRTCQGGVEGTEGYRVNVVLSGLLSRLYPQQERVQRLRKEANALSTEKREEEALSKYDQAIRISPGDHLLFSERSQIHCGLSHWDLALRDAHTACRLQPRWPQGYTRKAQLLTSLGRTEEALKDYLIGLSLDPDCPPARTEAQKLLSEILAPVSDQIPDQVLDYSGILSNRTHHKNLITTTPATQPIDLDMERNLLLKRKRQSSETEEEEEQELKRARTEAVSSTPVSTVDPADVECSLCMRLFLEPVTTPCGHTFCLQCLERCLDHNPKCPLCKEELSEYLERRQFSQTVLLKTLIHKLLPSELIDRQKIHQEEMDELSNLNKSVPIFVCTMAFPTVPCPLHIFEPCYRLMIRRCRETGTNRFGMCLGDQRKGFADYGCLLEIRDVKFFSDGRSVVETIGRRRFRVVQHQERDGYNTGDLEYLEDVKVEGAAEQELQKLHDSVYELGLVWVNSLRPEQKQRIEGHFGPMPPKEKHIQWSPNGPSWCWWLLAVLPLEGRAQLPFLAMTSLKDRLSGIRKVLLFMSQSRHR